MATSATVRVSARTWLHESLNLFDFEAGTETLQSASFTINGSGTCVRQGGSIWSVNGKHVPSRSKALLKCSQQGEQVEIDAVTTSSRSSKPWMVVQDLPSGHHKLSEGDCVMLGRAMLQVCQIVTDVADIRTPDVLGETTCLCEDLQSDAQCRICLMEGASEEDPFVVPCACKGSVEKVHLGCLRQWTKTRLNLPKGPAESFVFQKPICEMCKSDYPAYVQRPGEPREALVDALPAVSGPYIVLQSVGKPSKSHPEVQKVAYHVVSFAQSDKVLKIGRGHECGMRLDEVSMSRWHASIKFTGQDFIIEDHGSKFGTLLALKRPWTLQADVPVSVKVGRTVLTFVLPSSLDSPAQTAAAQPFNRSESGDLAVCGGVEKLNSFRADTQTA